MRESADLRGRQSVRDVALDRTAQKKIAVGFFSLFVNHFYYFIAAETCRLNSSIKNYTCGVF